MNPSEETLPGLPKIDTSLRIKSFAGKPSASTFIERLALPLIDM
jgi:hypothetical protein